MNAFLDIAEQQLAAPVKAKHRAAERREACAPMVKTPAEKKIHEQRQLVANWRSWHRDQTEELLAGPLGKEVKALMSIMRTMTLSSAPALVTIIENADWIKTADDETRRRVLHLVGEGIRRLRERNGLVPFDDSGLGEPPTAYEQIREMLR